MNSMSDEPAVTAPPAQIEDRASEPSLRPPMLKDFLGQRQAKENLETFIQAACSRQEALDHTLFYGPPGLGKTTLAHIVAREMGVQFRATSGPMLSRAGDLAAILSGLGPHDVLFIDEIHRLNPTVEEVLYPAMEDFMLDLIIGEGPGARTVRIDLPRFTLVGATTRLGLLSNPLRDRFGIPLRLEFYSPKELAAVLLKAAENLRTDLTEEGAHEIARRSRGTPRIALRLLRRVRDFAAQKPITASIADHALLKLEVDGCGLDRSDRRYLLFLAEHYGGGPVGIDTLAAALSEQRDVLEDTIEPYLLQQGFLQRTARGRMLSARAWEHLGLSAPPGTDATQAALPLQEETDNTV